MNINELRPIFDGKRCAILGFGREGRVWLSILQRLGCCAEIAVADMNPQDIPGVTGLYGGDYLDLAKGYDLLLQSPGVIIKDKLTAQEKEKILTQTELLLRLRPCRIVGITGTKGKSTTSSLTYHFLTACGYKTMLIGNIGVPPLERLEEMTPDTVAVCEMSCHQLEFVRHSPETAVLLNIFPEHLDHYVSLEAYAEAKRNIYRFQQAGDVSIMNIDIIPDEICTNAECGNAPECGNSGYRKSRLITIGYERPAMAFTENGGIFLPDGREIPAGEIHTQLRGRHNVYNILAALLAANAVGADIDRCLSSLPEFRGLEHRLEYVDTVNGVEYINDSICTIPEAAVAAVKAFPDGADCVILGGMERNIPYDKLADFLNTGYVRNVILLPDSGYRIGGMITSPLVNKVEVHDLPEAVSAAAKLAKRRVILCPAAASYGFYKNFEERGRHFKQLVAELRNK